MARRKKPELNDNNLAIAYYRFSSHSQNEASIVKEYENVTLQILENIRAALCEDEHSIRAYFERFMHADFSDPKVRGQVL